MGIFGIVLAKDGDRKCQYRIILYCSLNLMHFGI